MSSPGEILRGDGFISGGIQTHGRGQNPLTVPGQIPETLEIQMETAAVGSFGISHRRLDTSRLVCHLGPDRQKSHRPRLQFTFCVTSKMVMWEGRLNDQKDFVIGGAQSVPHASVANFPASSSPSQPFFKLPLPRPQTH